MFRVRQKRLVATALVILAVIYIYDSVQKPSLIQQSRTPHLKRHLRKYKPPEHASPERLEPADTNLRPSQDNLDTNYEDIMKNDKESTESWMDHCVDARRPKHVEYTIYGKWQITRRGEDEIIAYSAFYDDRTDIGPIPVIQILTVANTKSDIYCHIWYEGMQTPYVTRVEIRASGRADHRFGGKTYGQFYYTCKLAKVEHVPTHVTLVGSECGESTILLPVVHSLKSEWTVEFGLCVAIAFGDFPKKRFIEWMEISKILGVNEIHIYNGTMTSTIKPVFDSYLKEGELFVHDMPPPVAAWTKMGAKLGSPASLNDCMLRYMYRYRYIIVVDIDETIVPRNATNYHDMINQINQANHLEEDLPVYTFRNTYFLFDFSPDDTEPEHLQSLRYQNRAKPFHGAWAPKSIVDPRRCLSVFNHYCYVQFDKWSKYRLYVVGNIFGLSHHYKKCNLGEKQCNKMISEKTKDDIMLKFKSQLIQNVNNRMKLLE